MKIEPRPANWQDVSEDYTKDAPEFVVALAHEIVNIFSASGFGPPLHLLEAGCGSGHLSAVLRKSGYATDLLDFTDTAILKAQDSFKAAFGKKAKSSRFICGDLLKLDELLNGRQYDIVWNSGVLEHFSRDDLVCALSQMKSAASQATFFIVPNPESLVYLSYRQKMLERQRWNVGVEFLRDDYIDAARAAGLKVHRTGYCGKIFTLNCLGFAVASDTDRSGFENAIQGGLTPDQALCLQYFLCVPAKSRKHLRKKKGRDSSSMLDKAFYLDALGTANGTISHLQRQLADGIVSTSEKVSSLRVQLHEANERVETLNVELSEKIEEVESVNNQLAVVKSEKAAAIESLSEELNSREHQIRKLTDEIVSTSEEVSSLRVQLHEANEKAETLNAELSEKIEEVESVNNQLAVVKSEKAAAIEEVQKATLITEGYRRRIEEITAAHQHLGWLLSSVGQSARKIVEMLEEMKTRKSFRLVHLMQFLRHNVGRGTVSHRFKSAGRALLRCFGRCKPLWQFNVLEAPGDHAREIVSIVDQGRNRKASEELSSDVFIPSPCPTTVPFTAARAPHGRRRVACLTNQLFDWNDHRPRFGGGERYAVTLANLLRDLGLEVHFFQPASRSLEDEYFGFPVKGLPLGDFFSEFHYGACNAFAEMTREYDHILYNMPEYASGTVREDALLVCHGIWFDHNNYPSASFRTPRWYAHLGRVFANPKCIVSVDTNSINYIRAMWPDLADKMRFIPNFFDEKVFFPAPEARSPDQLMILFPRRSQINRGSRILSDILERIPHNVRICWVGEGDPEDTKIIQGVCKRDTRLSFHAATFDTMPAGYQQADIAVIPTIACEGTSLSCIEALACGCAVAATHVGGLSDVVHTDRNGILVDPNPAAIADAINLLIEDVDERKRLQEEAAKSVRPFELNCWRARWTKLLRNLGWVPDESPRRTGAGCGKSSRQTRQASTDIQTNVDIDEKRIAIVTRSAIHGGVESIVAVQSTALRAPVIVAGGVDFPKTCPFSYKRADNYDSLRRILGQFDLVLYHWLPNWAVQAIADTGLPCVEFVHRADTCDNDKTIPSVIVTHSQYLAEYVSKAFQRKCHLVEHPIDTSEFRPPERLGICIGAVTSYYKTKGLDIFLEAWARLQSDFPDLRVRFYGEGPERDRLRRLAKRLGIKAEFRAAVSQPHHVLQDYRCIVIPSRVEGLPMTVLEGLAMDIPVVASKLDGVLEFNNLAAERACAPPVVTFPTEDIDALSEALRKVLCNNSRPNTSHYISEFYSIRKHFESLKESLRLALVKGDKEPLERQVVATWYDQEQLGNQYTGLGAFHVSTADPKKGIYPASITDFRKARLTDSLFACFRVSLPSGLSLLEAQATPKSNSQAWVSIQVDWLDEQNQYLVCDSDTVFLRPKRSAGVLFKVPPRAAIATVNLRPHAGYSLKLDSFRIRAFGDSEHVGNQAQVAIEKHCTL